MLPRLGSKFISQWIVATLVASVVSAIGNGWLASWLALAPSRIFRGELWRLVTWPLVQAGPLGLVLTCVAIYKFGGELAYRWGDRRLRRFALEVTLAASVLTCVIAAVAGATFMRRVGGWAMADALVIAWARQFPNATLTVYGLLHLRGQQLITLTIAVAILFALWGSPIWMAPELIACFVAARYPTGWLRR